RVARGEEVRPRVVGATRRGSCGPGRGRRAEPKGKLDSLVLCGEGDGLADAAKRAATVAEWTNRARNLVNSPPNETTPERLAERAQEIASSVEHVSAEALGPDQIEKLGMGALAAVAQGSDNPARLVVLRYDPPEPAH